MSFSNNSLVGAGQYLNTFVFKYVFNYISVFKYWYLTTFVMLYLASIYNYFFVYLNTGYLITENPNF